MRNSNLRNTSQFDKSQSIKRALQLIATKINNITHQPISPRRNIKKINHTHLNINMKSISSLVIALSAPAAMAFAPSSTTRQSTTLQNTLRDIASFQDDMKMMNEFEVFDRNGAFSRSPQGGMGGRPDMFGMGQREMQMGGGNPFARGDRMYTQDGFDPYSAYGNSFGMSQSDNRRGPGGPRGQRMGEYYGGGPGMMMGPGGMNGVRNTDTMNGFEYDSRTSRRGPGGQMGGPMGGEYFDQGMGGMGGFDGPMDMGMGGPGMEYGGYDGQFEGGQDMRGDMSRLGP